jgi:tripartite-type tricarboxylate transporter receptor subunit TctC
MSLRRLLRVAVLGAVLCSINAMAQVPADSHPYPSRAIRLIVSFTPGGGADLTARTVGQRMAELLHHPVLIENRPGANGLVGAELAAKAAPDGYTMLLTDRGALGVNPSLYRKLPYDPLRDFEYLGIVTVASYVLVVDPRLPVKTVADLVQFAKAKPATVNYASFGIASMAHLNLEAFKARLGIDLTHVPYKGAGPAVQAVVAGEAGVTIASPAAVLGFLKSGRLRAIGIGAKTRSSLLPDVPTLGDAGGGEDTLASTYFAFALPANTPRPIVDRLHDVMKQALGTREVVDRLRTAGLEPIGSTGEELRDLVTRDIPRFQALVREIGVQAE